LFAEPPPPQVFGDAQGTQIDMAGPQSMLELPGAQVLFAVSQQPVGHSEPVEHPHPPLMHPVPELLTLQLVQIPPPTPHSTLVVPGKQD
jgi:hypothetical protein